MTLSIRRDRHRSQRPKLPTQSGLHIALPPFLAGGGVERARLLGKEPRGLAEILVARSWTTLARLNPNLPHSEKESKRERSCLLHLCLNARFGRCRDKHDMCEVLMYDLDSRLQLHISSCNYKSAIPDRDSGLFGRGQCFLDCYQ